MSKKLVIVNPVQQVEHQEFWNESAVSVMRYPPTNLALLAALTPEDWDVRIVDETLETLPLDEADVVGITSMTPTATRAYDISAQFKQRGAATIIGGIHASMLPDEAIQHADCVVIGEAESVWPDVLHDFDRGELKQFYRGEHTTLDNLPIPRRDLLTHKYALDLASIETARGCPNDCEFCSVTAFNGRRFRPRPVEDVLDELGTIASKNVFFTDNTIMGYGKKGEERAIQLFKGMVECGMKKRWFSQVGIDIAYSEEVLKWAKRSGCSGLAIGFESVNEDALRAMNKVRNLKVGVERYKEGVKRIHHYGIAIAGAFILGSDGDTKDVFDKTSEFVLDAGVDASQFTVLTPLPGTRLFDNLRRDGRLLRTDFPSDWTHYDFTEVVYKPRHMTADELMEGLTRMYRDTGSRAMSIRRAIKTLLDSRSLIGTGIAYAWNRESAKLWMEKYDHTRDALPEDLRSASVDLDEAMQGIEVGAAGN